jgi:PAS domain-containing protein
MPTRQANEDGGGLRLVYRDATEAMRAQEALRHSEERFPE